MAAVARRRIADIELARCAPASGGEQIVMKTPGVRRDFIATILLVGQSITRTSSTSGSQTDAIVTGGGVSYSKADDIVCRGFSRAADRNQQFVFSCCLEVQ